MDNNNRVVNRITILEQIFFKLKKLILIFGIVSI